MDHTNECTRRSHRCQTPQQATNCADASKIVPASPARLSINCKAINQQFAQRLGHAANSSLQTCKGPMDRSAWNLNTFWSINWEVSSNLMLWRTAHRFARRHMNHIGRAKSDKCPACLQIVEPDWHILSRPTSSLWQEELLHALGDTVATNHTQPSNPAFILLQGI
jgi:hypothetical protein